MLHYLLVFEFDVLMSYAVTAMIVAWLIGRSDRAVRAWMIAVGTLQVLVVGLLTVAIASAAPSRLNRRCRSPPTAGPIRRSTGSRWHLELVWHRAYQVPQRRTQLQPVPH